MLLLHRIDSRLNWSVLTQPFHLHLYLVVCACPLYRNILYGMTSVKRDREEEREKRQGEEEREVHTQRERERERE